MDFEMDVIWSARAKITFFAVLEYLNENWTKKEILQFSQRVQIVINAIKKNPCLFSGSARNKEIRKAIVDKNNVFFYRIDTHHQRIYLLTFFDCRQNPQKLLI